MPIVLGTHFRTTLGASINTNQGSTRIPRFSYDGWQTHFDSHSFTVPMLHEIPVDDHYVNIDADCAACLNCELHLKHQCGVMRCHHMSLVSNANLKALLRVVE